MRTDPEPPTDHVRSRASRLFAAMSHPTRLDLLDALQERVLSPTELASRIGEPLPRVVHHVRRLSELACIELVERSIVGGAVKHYYRRAEHPWFEHEDFGPLGPAPRQILVDIAVEALMREVERAGVDSFRDGDYDLERLRLTLDEFGWQELDRAVGELMADVQRIGEEAGERLLAAPRDHPRRRTAFGLLKFRSGRDSESQFRAAS